MKIWTVAFNYKDEKGVWSSYRVIAKDYKEAVEKALKVADFKYEQDDFRVTRIEEEEDELDSL
jgi:CO dehydrogenase/acetyl-CoA synthase beta subunit